MKIARESAQKVLDATSGENASAKEAFAKFATRLKERLEALASPHNCKQLSTQKQRLWSGFHSARISELRSLWTDMYTSLGLESRCAQDPLLGEYVNKKMVGECIKDKFHVESQESEPAELTMISMLFGMQQGMYHASSGRKPTCKHPNRKAFLVCLDKMSEGYQEESEDSYLDYTKRWIRAVDRGGLFRINEVYVLFYEIEKKVRQFLVKLIGQSSQLDKE